MKAFLACCGFRHDSEEALDEIVYVDEDAAKYYIHLLGSTSVYSAADKSIVIHGINEEEEGATLRRKEKHPDWEDDKLCRVRIQDSVPGDVPKLDAAREAFLKSEEANQKYWFELACRFGRQLTVQQWQREREALQTAGKRIVKLAGFDGGSALSGVPWDAVSAELAKKADIVIWDGDWYSDQGWTHKIPEFLRADPNRLAVAFQKKAEVPGFHRQYWHVYKAFPGRVWMVVLDDDFGSGAIPEEVTKRLLWLEEQVQSGAMKKCWPDKYAGVAMVGRSLQGPAPVIALNGGGVCVAQAAVELLQGERNISWTVFPAQRGNRKDDPDSTLFGFLQKYPGLENVTMVTA